MIPVDVVWHLVGWNEFNHGLISNIGIILGDGASEDVTIIVGTKYDVKYVEV